LTILRDGTTELSELVFCEAELRSVAVCACNACPFADPDAGETVRHGMVHCARSVFPIAGNANDLSFPPAAAAALPVGMALVRPVVCVEDSLPWVEAARTTLLPEGPYGVPIVERGGALVGLLPPAALAPGSGDWPVDPVGSVAGHAVSAVSVHESESLGQAFATMGMRRMREVTVVGDGRIVVGVLRDVDALHFVAHVARTGKRPASKRVA